MFPYTRSQAPHCPPAQPRHPRRATAGSRPTPARPSQRPSAAAYRRRRLGVAGVIVAGSLLVGGLAACGALADPGGVPASAAGIRQASTDRTVTTRHGDSLWTIAKRAYAAEHRHRAVSFSTYVDAVVELNGETSLRVGQQVRLP